MVLINNYSVAVILSIITMICWGSWANTQKLASKSWKFQLFYWDYGIGVVLISLLVSLTLGSFGEGGRSFIPDLFQANRESYGMAILGGAVFNASNILLVGAVDIAGLSVAFPLAIGLALIIATISNYIAQPIGDPYLIFIGVACVIIALLADGLAYNRLSSKGNKTPLKGIALSVLAGVLMGFFYRFVAESMSNNFQLPEPGKFGLMLLLPYFLLVYSYQISFFNTILMKKPFIGDPIPIKNYFKDGSVKLHLIGISGGLIWGLGMILSILSAGTAGYAISYGLGAQGGTLIAALWGIFIWKEFKNAPPKTNLLLGIMFFFYIIGLVCVVMAR